MGGKEVRTLKFASYFALALVGATFGARAQSGDADDALRRPERITVGINDQFLGQLAPDEKTLYFVTNRATRKEIYRQDIDEGRARQVFDEGAEVTWPRVSPDGEAILYISFGDQATGQLCVRNLPDGDERRCLTDTPAALQAEWIDRNRIVLINRTSIQGNLRVSEVTVASQLSRRTLFDQNRTSPAVSPDGRWLVYIPLDRVAKRLGPGFAARAVRGFEAVRLDRSGGKALPLIVDLPGVTAQPAFSRDGQFLYFVQFFIDSNHDGVLDASDNGVLFRLPFASKAEDAPSRAAQAAPLQLTSARLNCQYPAPAAHRLIATCSRGDLLDVYELPLDGAIPGDWTTERLRAESELATRQADQVLLDRQRFALETDRTARRLLLMRLLMTHLEQDEFDAAEFYAGKIKALRGDPATRGLGQPLRLLIEHRRARTSQERGRTIDTFADEAKAQFDRLIDGPKDTPVARTMNRIVRSEIADSIGDKTTAQLELEAAVIDDATPPPVIKAYFARADALYRELDDRDALVSACRRLAASNSLSADERLDYARAAARALVRGRPNDEADALLARERQAEPGDTELGFALDLTRAMLLIRDQGRQRGLKARFVALYQAQQRPGRKRAVVFDVVGRAAEAGADGIIEGLSERYLDDVTPGTQEGRRASRLYGRALLGRAYRRLAQGRLDEARTDLDAVLRRTDSFEAAVELINLRLGQGAPQAAIETELAPGADPNSPLKRFIKAYLIARSLPQLDEEMRAEAVTDATELLRASWSTLKSKGEVRALRGAIMHEQYLRTGDPALAEKANSQYMVALELMQKNPRYRAMILGQLGLLHTQVSNYRIALGYLEQRARLPFTGDAEEFAVRLATARVLLHVDRAKESAEMAEKALAVLDGLPKLAPLRVLALDRTALYNLAADQFERALALYDAEVPLLATDESPAARRNRLVVRLARAAAAVGARLPRRALQDLDAVEPSLEDPELVKTLASPYVTAEDAGRSYKAIAAGLRANATLALGELPASALALERRRAMLEQRLAKSERDEDVRELTLVEARLAANARARHDYALAVKWLGKALDRADSLVARTHTPVDIDQLRVLWLGAELYALGHPPVSFDLPKRLKETHGKLVQQRDPTLNTYKRWFEIYLPLTKPNRADTAGK
jgi:Tol biopolymer transport system component/tetratricopeptide (TPR) repeat protein